MSYPSAAASGRGRREQRCLNLAAASWPGPRAESENPRCFEGDADAARAYSHRLHVLSSPQRTRARRSAGRRGDGADGHSWAGGLGTLIDIEGDDSYTAGNWSLGTGYWFGTGLVYEGGGNDTYRGVVWSQGSGAHFCIGALLDEGGNDKHLMELDARNGLAFGHDFSIALLVNLGGDDLYEIKNSGLGLSINRSVAMLIDSGGEDTYSGNENDRPGMSQFHKRLEDRTGMSTYFADTTSLGLFLDIGGNDTYTPKRSNNSYWKDPEDSPNWNVRNFSIGWDVRKGELNLGPIPENGHLAYW